MTAWKQTAEDICQIIESTAVWRANSSSSRERANRNTYQTNNGLAECRIENEPGAWFAVWYLNGKECHRDEIIAEIAARLSQKMESRK